MFAVWIRIPNVYVSISNKNEIAFEHEEDCKKPEIIKREKREIKYK